MGKVIIGLRDCFLCITSKILFTSNPRMRNKLIYISSKVFDIKEWNLRSTVCHFLVTVNSRIDDKNFYAVCPQKVLHTWDYPPASEASREAANLTERKKSAYPGIWCQRICLSSVCLWSNLTPNIPCCTNYFIRS